MNKEETKYIRNLFIIGYDIESIIEFSEEKFEKKFNDENVKKEISSILKELSEKTINSDLEKSLQFERYKILYQRAFNIQDFKLCVQIEGLISDFIDENNIL